MATQTILYFPLGSTQNPIDLTGDEEKSTPDLFINFMPASKAPRAAPIDPFGAIFCTVDDHKEFSEFMDEYNEAKRKLDRKNRKRNRQQLEEAMVVVEEQDPLDLFVDMIDDDLSCYWDNNQLYWKDPSDYQFNEFDFLTDEDFDACDEM